jgi:hypothetical protein
MLDDADVYFAFIFAFDYALYFYSAESRIKYFFGPMQAIYLYIYMYILLSLSLSLSFSLSLSLSLYVYIYM